jgi:hypothetical protein
VKEITTFDFTMSLTDMIVTVAKSHPSGNSHFSADLPTPFWAFELDDKLAVLARPALPQIIPFLISSMQNTMYIYQYAT